MTTPRPTPSRTATLISLPFAMTLLCLQAPPLLAATFLVGPSDEAGLIDAISSANATPQADIIELTPSTYTFLTPDNLTNGPNALPSIMSNIRINGHGATLRRAIFASGDLRLLHVAAAGRLLVDDITMTGGWLTYAQGGTSDSQGGAIYSLGYLTLNNCRLQYNMANFGGAIAARSGRIDVVSSTFEDNGTDPNGSGSGGGLFVLQTQGQVSRSTFKENISRGSGGGAAQILLNAGQSFLIRNSQFELNRADEGTGGAIDTLDGQLSITGSRFIRNNAFVGGAMHLWDSQTRISDSTFTANGNGALVAQAAGGLLIESSTFNANRGGEHFPVYQIAGGVTARGHTVQIVNSTFSNNIGGAVVSGDTHLPIGPATVTIVNSTLSGGVAQNDFAGGVTNYPNGTLNLTNTIIANSLQGFDCVNYGAINDNAGNLIEDGSCAPALIGDPKLDILGNNGGPTRTHALLSGSPALDDAYPSGCPPLDQRGVARPVGPNCDIGAYEGTKLVLKPIRVDYQTKPRPYVVICDPLQPATIRVDLLGSERTAADTVIGQSVSLGGAPAGAGRVIGLADVNGDRRPDLAMEWTLRSAYSGLECARTTVLHLEGSTNLGQPFFAAVEVAPSRQ